MQSSGCLFLAEEGATVFFASWVNCGEVSILRFNEREHANAKQWVPISCRGGCNSLLCILGELR